MKLLFTKLSRFLLHFPSCFLNASGKSHKSADCDKVIFITVKWSQEYIYDILGWNWIKRQNSKKVWDTFQPPQNCHQMIAMKWAPRNLTRRRKEWSECTKINRAHERNFQKGEDDSTENTQTLNPASLKHYKLIKWNQEAFDMVICFHNFFLLVYACENVMNT